VPDGQATRAPEPGRLPVLFVSHGSPMVALETDDYTRALEGWAGGVPRPTAIVVVSAHWQASRPVRVATSAAPATIHDFYGFPPELYALRYTPPGEPGLGSEIIARLQDAGIEAEADPGRGLDHGVWVPLRFLYPGAEVPVVAVSLSAPARPRELLALGRALAPLRAAGILILGSGGVVHNLGRLDRRGESAPVTEWARGFDDWVRDRLEAGDAESLASYERLAPHALLAVPTSEHFDPLLVAVGAAAGDGRVQDVYEGFRFGSLSMRSFTLSV
jgi:4,5-DOPA dioxygenase extradiol